MAMKWLPQIIVLLLVLAAGTNVDAHRYESGQLEIPVPSGWKSQAEGEAFMFTDPSENVAFAVFPVPVKTPRDALPPSDLFKNQLGQIIGAVSFYKSPQNTHQAAARQHQSAESGHLRRGGR